MNDDFIILWLPLIIIILLIINPLERKLWIWINKKRNERKDTKTEKGE